MMGFDVWAEELSESDYLSTCQNSPKYKKGQWHVLLVDDQIVSSLITYENEFELPSNCIGIGSVATSTNSRKRGYASHLVNEIASIMESSEKSAIYLFSDIDASFYEKLGFELLTVPPKYSSSPCMIRNISNSSALAQIEPSYF